MGACLSSSTGDFITEDIIEKSNSALVISTDGDLRQYPTPAFVSDVIIQTTDSPSPSPSSSSFFVCNSDSLYLEEHIRALDLEAELEAGQIYFVLPNTKLHHRLTASDMAALAVKASRALNNSNSFNPSTSSSATSTRRRRSSSISSTSSKSKSAAANNNIGQRRKTNKAQISPFVVMETSQINVLIVDQEQQEGRNNGAGFVDLPVTNKHNQNQNQNARIGVSRTGSIRKLQRVSSSSSSSSSRTRRARLAVRSFKLRLSTIYENSDQPQH